LPTTVLRQPWSGLVWLNPPFNKRRGKAPWLRKFFAHANGIACVTAYTSCDWFHDLVVPHAQTLVFPRGKTKFLHAADGTIGKEPSTGSVLIGMGPGTDPIKALRSALKTLLRRFGLRCIEISETTNTNREAQSEAQFSDKTQRSV
jgi:hypothetical protein